LRPAFDALLDIDEAMGDVVAKATEPALAAIKLAWWRERLQELDAGKVPAEPRLMAAAEELLARSIAGSSLAELEDGWLTLLDSEPDIARVGERGAKLFAVAASLLGSTDPRVDDAGRLHAFASVRRWGLLAGQRPSDEVNALARHRFPRALRPLTAIAALAARDMRCGGPPFEPEATPGRALTLLRHRVTGRVA
jgi:phytoene synthase